MGRSKLKRFAQNVERHNVLEDSKALYKELKGNWNVLYFSKDQPITVELACGKAHYTTGLAAHFPNRNFVGVDVKGDRLWVGSTIAIEQNLNNTAFLRAQIEHLDQFFAPQEVNELWITFPDPRPKKRDIKRRLTSPRFLELYKLILHKNGLVNFKTDNTQLFDYTVELLQERKDTEIVAQTHDLYSSPLLADHYGIQTDFERKFLEKGETIKFLKFRFKNEG
ncbi:tRNA (guanosine(46)-N7)-methyltransferase TrmB [Roseivirga sp. UBA1976]|uniref:tRNA (guanosine(46)-N7)-methyltransferase TrmB n=1 Tax=Roseivirga sp. UBA1976 TaxID=1947386 RepID=UPI00257D2688|nr:tRNA (guanosine(46)-N7)-methyltransferase TrmB [Roseivirga sp. UBA1976]|tara:strand:- start:1425 stop:2093 length:669 start_codon:yes stop_codon:yes gene_type:complete